MANNTPLEQLRSTLGKSYINIVTPEGGEIFNDYSNNKAVFKGHAEGIGTIAAANGSHAQGYYTVAGTQVSAIGYKISNIKINDTENNDLIIQIQLGNNQFLDDTSFENYISGEQLGLDADKWYIYSANTNATKYKDPFTIDYNTNPSLLEESNGNGYIKIVSFSNINEKEDLVKQFEADKTKDSWYLVYNNFLNNVENGYGGLGCHAQGIGTKAIADAQHVQGKYNSPDDQLAFIIGNGTDDENRSNAFTVDWEGNVQTAGDIYVNGGNNKLITQEDKVNSAISADTATKVSKLLKIGSKSFDGSAEIEITAADLGLEQAMRFVGAYTEAPQIAINGDIYLNIDTKKEYIYSNGEWVEFGEDNVLQDAKDYVDEQDIFKTDIETIDTIGGITAGTNLNGLTTHQILTLLLYPYVDAVVGDAIATPNGGVYEKGTTQIITEVKISITKKSKPITSVALYNGSTLIEIKTGDEVKSGGEIAFTNLGIEVPTNGNQLTVEVTYPDADGVDKTVFKNTKFITFVYPYYMGTCAAGVTIDETLIKNLNKKIEIEGNKSNLFTISNGHMVFAYPKDYGALKSILDPNSFETINNYARYEINVTGLDGSAQPYYVYVSEATTVESFKVTFKY